MIFKKQILAIAIVVLIVIIMLFTWMNAQKETKNEKFIPFDPASPPLIGQVNLVVSDLQQSVDFYETIIGFKILEEAENKVTLTADGSTPLLILEEQTDSVDRPNGTTGLYHFAILLPDRPSLASVLNHLTESEYPIQGGSDHRYSEALYLADPDNNGIELYADRPPSTWKRNEAGEYEGGTFPMDVEGLLAQAGTEKWAGLPDKTRIGHMHLQVAELKMIENFYVDGLGFDIVSKGNGMLFVSKGGYHHHIGLNTWAGEGLPKPPENSRGLKLFTLFFTKKEIDMAKTQLESLGFPFDEDNGILIVEDPSGNQIQIFIR